MASMNELKKKYPEVRFCCGTDLGDIIKVHLKNDSGATLATITENDGMTTVLGDTDVKWLVCYDGTLSDMKGLLAGHGTDPEYWQMRVLCSTSPVLDEMLDTDGLRKRVNGFMARNGFLPVDFRLSAYYADAVRDISKVFGNVCCMPENVATEEASKIVAKSRCWDEQFVRSLELLKYVLCDEHKEDKDVLP